MAGSKSKDASNNGTQGARTSSRPKGRTRPVDVVLVVLLALTIGYGFTLVAGGETAVQAAARPEPTAEFLSSVIGDDSPASPPGASFPHIVYDEGQLYFRGFASDAAGVEDTVARLEPLFGEGNVTAEVLIDASFADSSGAPVAVYFAENVLFESGSAVIDPQFEDVLAASASLLQLTDETMIEISGHTDSDGTEESNLELSQARVDAARQAMIAAGGDPNRITAVGEGEMKPIADNATAEGRQLNRRVELSVSSFG